MANYRFIRDLPGGSGYHLGTAVQYPDGWRFLSNVSSHKSSRKYHATMEKCLPRWLGYPDKCRSEEVVIAQPTFRCTDGSTRCARCALHPDMCTCVASHPLRQMGLLS